MVISTFTILPTMLFLLFIIDLFFMGISAVVYPFLTIIIFTPIGRHAFDKYDEFMNKLFQQIFGMSVMDIKGFRCQRTILQLHLESIP